MRSEVKGDDECVASMFAPLRRPLLPIDALSFLAHLLCSFDAGLSLSTDEPGVYIMESGDGRKLYIGKSVKLSSRVPSYFNHGGDVTLAVSPAVSVSKRIAVMTKLVERYFLTLSWEVRRGRVGGQVRCRRSLTIYIYIYIFTEVGER